MDDLISRQAAIVRISKIIWDDAVAHDVKEVLKDLPSAQPQRKKGWWIRNDNGTYSCSVCQSWIPEEHHRYARYCLYCGADMGGGEND